MTNQNQQLPATPQATRRSKQGVSIVIVKAVAHSILMKIRRDCFAELMPKGS